MRRLFFEPTLDRLFDPIRNRASNLLGWLNQFFLIGRHLQFTIASFLKTYYLGHIHTFICHLTPPIFTGIWAHLSFGLLRNHHVWVEPSAGGKQKRGKPEKQLSRGPRSGSYPAGVDRISLILKHHKTSPVYGPKHAFNPLKTMVFGGCLILDGRDYFTKVSEELMCFFPLEQWEFAQQNRDRNSPRDGVARFGNLSWEPIWCSNDL